MERAIRHLRAGGEKIPSELMPYLAPLGWQHINLTGDYIWTEPSRLEGEGFRPLNGVVELDPRRCSRSVRLAWFSARSMSSPLCGDDHGKTCDPVAAGAQEPTGLAACAKGRQR